MTPTAPRLQSLRQYRDFAGVQERGARCGARYATVYWLPRAEGAAYRVATAARRHLAGAVERNRAKRRIREAFRRLAPPPPPAADVLFVVKKEIFSAAYRDIEEDIKKVIDKNRP